MEVDRAQATHTTSMSRSLTRPPSPFGISFPARRPEPELEPWLTMARSVAAGVTICEAGVGAPIPGRTDRVAWWQALSATRRPACAVFTDAARTGAVWAFRRSVGPGAAVYVEHRVPKRQRTLAAELELWNQENADGQSRRSSGGARAQRRAAAFLCSRLFPEIRPVSSLEELLLAIEGLPGPAATRAALRTLTGLRLIATSLADIERLLGMADAVVTVLFAAADRARAHVDDTSGIRRPEHLADLKRFVDGAEAEWTAADRLAYLRGMVLQRNLYALVRPPEAPEVDRRFRSWGRLGIDAVPPVDWNVAVVSAATHGPSVPVSRGTGGEVDALERAWSAARAARLARATPTRQIEVAARQLVARRAALLSPPDGEQLDDGQLSRWFAVPEAPFLPMSSW